MSDANSFLDSLLPQDINSKQNINSAKDQSRSKSYQDVDNFLNGLLSENTFNPIQNNQDNRSYLDRIGQGFFRGIKDVGDVIAGGLTEGVARGAEFIAPNSQITKDIRAEVNQAHVNATGMRDKYNEQNPESDTWIPNVANVGRFGGQVLATAPFMPVRGFQAMRGAMNALPTVTVAGERIAAPLLNRLGASAVEGATGGAILGGLTSSTNDKGFLENAGEGAITGAIGAPALTALGAGAKAAGRSVIGSVSPRVNELANRANDLGIDLKASQVSRSPLFKKYDQMAGMLPFSGVSGENDKQLGQFMRAVSKTFGENETSWTPETLDRARRNIGQRMNNVASRNIFTLDNDFAKDIGNIWKDVNITATEPEIKPIRNLLNEIINKFDPENGTMLGESYKNLTNYNGIISKAQKSNNPAISHAANNIRTALDDLFERSVSPSDLAELRLARQHYKALKTVEPLIEKSQDGTIAPLQLLNAVMKAPGGKLRSGELGELADIGRAFFPQPADSGTPLGNQVIKPILDWVKAPATMAAGIGSVAALGGGLTALDASLTPLALAANRGMRKGLNSAPVREAILNPGREGFTDRAADAIAPYASLPAKAPINRLKLTINPEDKKDQQ